MQMFGRSHRTNQAHPPKYLMLVTDMGGENRFVSTIAKRLASLGAITKGQSNAATGTDLMDKVNFESDEGEASTNSFYLAMLADREIPGVTHTVMDDALPDDQQNQDPKAGAKVKWRAFQNDDWSYGKVVDGDLDTVNRLSVQPDWSEDSDQALKRQRSSLVLVGEPREVQVPLRGMTLLGQMHVLKDIPGQGLTVKREDRTNVTKLLNRMLALDPDIQNAVYGYFYDIFQATVQRAIDNGTLDTGVKQLPGEKFHITEDRTISTDPKNGSKTIYYPVDSEVKTYRMPAKTLKDTYMREDEPDDERAAIWKNDKGTLIARRMADPIVRADGRIDPASRISKPGRGGWTKVPDATLHGYHSVEDIAKDAISEAETKATDAKSEVERAEAKLKTPLSYWERAGERERTVEFAKSNLARLEEALAAAQKEHSDPVGKALEEWQKQYEAAPTHVTVRHHLIGGAVLRWWNAVREANPRLEIFTTVDSVTGKRVVGVEIPEANIGNLINRISGGASTVNANQLYTDVLRNNLRYTLEGGISVQRARISGSNVVKFIPPDDATGRTLRAMGLQHEVGLGGETFYLGNDHDTVGPVLKRILAQFPVTQQSTTNNATANRTMPVGDPRAGYINLGDLDALLKKIFGKKAKDVDYQAFGAGTATATDKEDVEEPNLEYFYSFRKAVKSFVAPGGNLSQIRAASKPAWRALVEMAAVESAARATLRLAELQINTALEKAPIKFDELRKYYSQSRLDGIRERWYDFAQQADDMSDEELLESFGGAFKNLLASIQNKRGIPQNVLQTAESLATRQDWSTLREFLHDTFTDAADFVHEMMPPAEFQRIHDLVANNDDVAKADKVYRDAIEGFMQEKHSEHEGVMATALGPAGVYIPLVGAVPEKAKARGGFNISPKRLLNKPKNERNLMATGISSRGYDTSVEALETALIKAARASSKFQAIEAMEKAGILKKLSPKDQAPAYFKYQGRYFEPHVHEVVAPRPMVVKENGVTRVVHLPAQRVVMPKSLFMEAVHVLDQKNIENSDARTLQEIMSRFLKPLNDISIMGPQLAIIDSYNIVNTLTANTQFLGPALATKMGSLVPLTKRLTAAIELVRQGTIESIALDPATLNEIVEMAKLGMIPAKYGSKTWSDEFAAMSGAKKVGVMDSSPWLYGPAGIDIRGRLQMYRIAKAFYPGAAPEEIHDFVNQIGTYVPALQSTLERGLKYTGLSPFYTRGAQMLINGVNSIAGTGPIYSIKHGEGGDRLLSGGKGKIARARGRLMALLGGGAMVLLATWLFISKELGWKPNGLFTSELPHELIPDSVRHGKFGHQMGWDRPGSMTVDFLAMFNPILARGLRATGLLGTVNAMFAGASLGQALSAGSAQAVSTLAQPVIGPVGRAAFVGLTGRQPYLTGWSDRTGTSGMQFFPVTPTRSTPFATLAEHLAAAAISTNASESQMGQATGFLSPYAEHGSDHSWRILEGAANIAFPGISPKVVNDYARQQFYYQQRRGMK